VLDRYLFLPYRSARHRIATAHQYLPHQNLEKVQRTEVAVIVVLRQIVIDNSLLMSGVG